MERATPPAQHVRDSDHSGRFSEPGSTTKWGSRGKVTITHHKPANQLSKSEKLAIITRSYGLCVYCGAWRDLGFDHIVPGSRGGSNEIDNLVACCRSCNSLKCHREVEYMRHHLALRHLGWPKMSREMMEWAAERGADMQPYLEWKFWYERGTTKGALATRKLIEGADRNAVSLYG
jgi:5-methylcytosine-specific restriction endonuclease McrA